MFSLTLPMLISNGFQDRAKFVIVVKTGNQRLALGVDNLGERSSYSQSFNIGFRA
jgi:hypothetical protein